MSNPGMFEPISGGTLAHYLEGPSGPLFMTVGLEGDSSVDDGVIWLNLSSFHTVYIPVDEGSEQEAVALATPFAESLGGDVGTEPVVYRTVSSAGIFWACSWANQEGSEPSRFGQAVRITLTFDFPTGVVTGCYLVGNDESPLTFRAEVPVEHRDTMWRRFACATSNGADRLGLTGA